MKKPSEFEEKKRGLKLQIWNWQEFMHRDRVVFIAWKEHDEKELRKERTLVEIWHLMSHLQSQVRLTKWSSMVNRPLKRPCMSIFCEQATKGGVYLSDRVVTFTNSQLLW